MLFRILLAMLCAVEGLWDPPGHLLPAFPAQCSFLALVYMTTQGADFLPLVACALSVVLTGSGSTEYLLLSMIGATVDRESGRVLA